MDRICALCILVTSVFGYGECDVGMHNPVCTNLNVRVWGAPSPRRPGSLRTTYRLPRHQWAGCVQPGAKFCDVVLTRLSRHMWSRSPIGITGPNVCITVCDSQTTLAETESSQSHKWLHRPAAMHHQERITNKKQTARVQRLDN